MAPLSSASRATSYVAKPTAELRARLDEASAPGLYVVQEPGPTSFVLKAEGSERKHRVNIGSVHSCSCGGWRSTGAWRLRPEFYAYRM